MDPCFRDGRRSVFILLTSLLFALLRASPAFGAPKDAAAVKLAEEAIDTDYLATNFAEAEKKLRRAVAMCGATDCTPKVRARVQRDLGVVLIAGLNRQDDGKKAFAEALAADPDVTLDKALTTPEIERIFRAVKAGGAAGAKAGGPAGTPARTAERAAGDMMHTPPVEQTVLTPVPIYVEVPEDVTPAKVVVRYKAFGQVEWKTLELRRLGKGFGGEVPCQDVGSSTGDFLYFVQATDQVGDVVATSGSRASPHKVAIKNMIGIDPPHLPGVVPPNKCVDTVDCPPGLPGCPAGKAPAGKGWGATCEQDGECNEGLTCKNGVCESGEKSDAEEPPSSGRLCDTTTECDPGEICTTAKVCEREARRRKRVWLSLNLGQDLSFLASQPNVCGSPLKLPPSQYKCIDRDGYNYEGIPEASGPGRGNAINGGVHLPSPRIMAGVDVLVADNVTLGARLGYVFGVAPGRPMGHLHAELRAAFWFGKDPFAREGFRPYLVVAGGLAEIDDKLEVGVVETDLSKGIYPRQNLTVWRRTGGGFAGGGGGVMIPLAAGHALLGEVKLQALFPDFGLALAPSIGYALGL